MKSVRSRIALAAVSAGLILAASPAFAWVCTAKNARGATYSSFGLVKATASARALAKCRAGSVADNSCHIVSCSP